jgi:hypothetical protein
MDKRRSKVRIQVDLIAEEAFRPQGQKAVKDISRAAFLHCSYRDGDVAALRRAHKLLLTDLTGSDLNSDMRREAFRANSMITVKLVAAIDGHITHADRAKEMWRNVWLLFRQFNILG